MLLSGFAAFTPKFVQSQFGVSTGWAAMLTGKNSDRCIDLKAAVANNIPILSFLLQYPL